MQKRSGYFLFIDFKEEYKSPEHRAVKEGGGKTVPKLYSWTQKKGKNEFVIYCSSEAAITNTLEIYPFYASILLALVLCCS